MSVPTQTRPTQTRPTGHKRALQGKWLTPFLLAVALGLLSVPLLIVEDRGSASGKPGDPGSLALSEDAPVVPGQLDVVFLIDRSTSYKGDLENMATLIPRAVQSLAQSSDLHVGVASFSDGSATGAFMVNRPLGPTGPNLGATFRNLPVGNSPNNDWPEMALTGLTQTLESFPFREGAQRVVLVATDASSKTPPGTTAEAVATRYANADVRIVPLIAPDGDSSDRELLEAQAGTLASRTGASVQTLANTDSSTIDQAILAGLENLPVDMHPVLLAGCPFSQHSISPDRIDGANGGQQYEFELDYQFSDDAPAGTTICTVDLGGESQQTFEVRIEES